MRHFPGFRIQYGDLKEEEPDIVTCDLRFFTTMTVGIFWEFCRTVTRTNWLNTVLKVTNSDEIDPPKTFKVPSKALLPCSAPEVPGWCVVIVQVNSLSMRRTDDGQLCCSKKYAIFTRLSWKLSHFELFLLPIFKVALRRYVFLHLLSRDRK